MLCIPACPWGEVVKGADRKMDCAEYGVQGPKTEAHHYISGSIGFNVEQFVHVNQSILALSIPNCDMVSNPVVRRLS